MTNVSKNALVSMNASTRRLARTFVAKPRASDPRTRSLNAGAEIGDRVRWTLMAAPQLPIASFVPGKVQRVQPRPIGQLDSVLS